MILPETQSERQEFVKKVRQSLLKTQAEYAEILGVTQPTVSKWENGLLDVTNRDLRAVYTTVDPAKANQLC